MFLPINSYEMLLLIDRQSEHLPILLNLHDSI